MDKIRVSFFSVQPMVVSSLKNFFSNSAIIIPEFTSDYNIFNNSKNKIIVIDDGSLSKKQIGKIISGSSNIHKIILFTAHTGKEYFYTFFLNEIGGIVSKRTELPALQEAIVQVSAGGNYFCKYTQETLKHVEEEKNNETSLTKREFEVLGFVTKGYKGREIAGMLYISSDAVYTHIHNIKRKLAIGSIKVLTGAMLAMFSINLFIPV